MCILCDRFGGNKMGSRIDMFIPTKRMDKLEEIRNFKEEHSLTYWNLLLEGYRVLKRRYEE